MEIQASSNQASANLASAKQSSENQVSLDIAPYQDRWWDLPAVFLLVVVMTAGFTRLIATQWTEGLTITRTLTYLGLIAGLALGYSRFSPRTAFLFAASYGLFAIPWRLGLALGEGILWQERLGSLAGRLTITINQLARQQAVTDNLLFLTLMSILFWTLAVHAGYTLTRYANPWRTVLPTGLAIVVIHSYDAYLAQRAWYLVLYLFFALLLVTRLVYLQRRKRWEQTNTYIPPQLGVDFIRIALAATVVLLLLAWTAPALADSLPAAETAWEKIKQPWDRVRDRFDNAFASLRSSVGVSSDYYGTSLPLGRGNRLTDSVVFSVQAPTNLPDGTRLYWRARVFDQYQSGAWNSTLTASHNVNPQTFDLKFPAEVRRSPGLYSFTISLKTSVATLFTVPQPQWVSRPARAELTYNPDGTADVGSFRATPSLRSGETYSVRSSLSGVTVYQLRQAGIVYPDWVTERYLELPASITPRTKALAQKIAEGWDNPYDKAEAITNWLRNNMQYNETVPPVPQNQDPVDWFLFDLKQGFCNYYASAEVILLRSLGIPARMSVGFAQGEFDDITNQYVIRQRDAHAWPEVYFPSLGWIEFEPTAGQPSLERPLGQAQNNDIPQPSTDPLADSRQLQRPPFEPITSIGEPTFIQKNSALLRWIAAAILVLILAVLLIPMGWKRRLLDKMSPLPILLEHGLRRVGIQPPPILKRWARRAALSPLARSYLEIDHALSRLGRSASPANTPAERVVLLSQQLPAAQPPAQRLLTEYHSATYGTQTPNLEEAHRAGVEIRSLSLRALFQNLFRGREDPQKDPYRKYR